MLFLCTKELKLKLLKLQLTVSEIMQVSYIILNGSPGILYLIMIRVYIYNAISATLKGRIVHVRTCILYIFIGGRAARKKGFSDLLRWVA